MKQLQIDEKMKELWPATRVGCFRYKVRVEKKNEEMWKYLKKEIFKKVKDDIFDYGINEIPNIRESRQGRLPRQAREKRGAAYRSMHWIMPVDQRFRCFQDWAKVRGCSSKVTASGTHQILWPRRAQREENSMSSVMVLVFQPPWPFRISIETMKPLPLMMALRPRLARAWL